MVLAQLLTELYVRAKLTTVARGYAMMEQCHLRSRLEGPGEDTPATVLSQHALPSASHLFRCHMRVFRTCVYVTYCMEHVWRSGDNLRCQAPPFTVFEMGSLCSSAMCAGLTPGAATPVPASHLPEENTGIIGIRAMHVTFMSVPGL